MQDLPMMKQRWLVPPSPAAIPSPAKGWGDSLSTSIPLAIWRGRQNAARWTVRMGAFCVLTLLTVVCRAEPVSIPEFLAREHQFGDLAGSSFKLEGRVSTMTATELRMKGTDLKFVFEKSLERPRTSNVQLTGRLERDGRTFRVIVQTLSDYKPDLDIVRDRLRGSDITDPETYFKLAQWTVDRAKFYGDESLDAEVLRLRTLGVQTAQRRVSKADSSATLALADKAVEWGLDERLHKQLLHAATRIELLNEASNRVPAYPAVLNRIRTRFPASQEPLTEIPQTMSDMYAAKPDNSYEQADDEQRLILERLVFIETAIKASEQDLQADGSNGYAVAATVSRLVPERPDLVTKYRGKELDFQESRLPRMGRAEVLEFRNRLRDAGQVDRGTAVVRKWIDLQLIRRPKSPETDVDRAELEFEMTGDNDRALALVSSAMTLDPQVPGGAELLSLMGYGWHGGKAVLKALVPPAPPDPFAEAIQQGRILVGMGERQVRAALQGAPESVVRMARQGGTTELWHYPAQRLTLQLESTRQKPQLVVARILEQKPPAK